MSKKFQLKDKVSWLDDDLTGKIVEVLSNGMFMVETEEGFLMKASSKELILIPTKVKLSVNDKELQQQLRLKEKSQQKPRSFKRASKQIPALEVDLHIEAIVENTRGLTNYDMLNKQLETAQQQLYFARTKRIKRVVFIHGVGEGVLKSELETLLRRHDDLDFYPADVREYGYGATEVYFFEQQGNR